MNKAMLLSISALGLSVFGPKLSDAEWVKQAATFQAELVSYDVAGLTNRVSPVSDYETASRRSGGFVIQKAD